MNYLARREHSRAELARKLAPHAEADEIEALLDQLQRDQLLSNSLDGEMLAPSRGGTLGRLRV